MGNTETKQQTVFVPINNKCDQKKTLTKQTANSITESDQKKALTKPTTNSIMDFGPTIPSELGFQMYDDDPDNNNDESSLLHPSPFPRIRMINYSTINFPTDRNNGTIHNGKKCNPLNFLGK